MLYVISCSQGESNMYRHTAHPVIVILLLLCLLFSQAAFVDAEIHSSNIQSLRALNWTIYTDPETMVKRNFVRYMAADTIRFAWSSNDQSIRKSFADENQILELLLDEDMANDELKCIMITEDGFAYMVLYAGDPESGWIDLNDDERRRIYIAEKKLDPETAESLAKIRGVVMVFRAKERPLFGVPGVEYLLNPFSDGH